jgi:hypothetical protein|tara:strand:- start:190 stop:615 length:426 start_codon:yes stop_codon:yes gene_type:complete
MNSHARLIIIQEVRTIIDRLFKRDQKLSNRSVKADPTGLKLTPKSTAELEKRNKLHADPRVRGIVQSAIKSDALSNLSTGDGNDPNPARRTAERIHTMALHSADLKQKDLVGYERRLRDINAPKLHQTMARLRTRMGEVKQ